MSDKSKTMDNQKADGSELIPPSCSRKLRRRKCGKCSANEFITKLERSQRIQIQRNMWYLVKENKELGGKYWKKVLQQYGMDWKDLFPSANAELKHGATK